jgi:MerR family copper efflux transcriptional regulator
MHHIGEVAEAIGLSLRSIRYYEETGLAPPSGRTAGGFRLYTEADIDRLRLIMVMKPLGFSLEEMRLVFEATDTLAAGGSPAELASHRDRLAMFVAVAEERCERLREQLTAAESFISMLHRQTKASRRS